MPAHFWDLPTIGVTVALERSRSGKADIFDFLCGSDLRDCGEKFWVASLTETMENRPEIGLSSYDPAFSQPGYDAKGGFGNLIALRRCKKGHGKLEIRFF